MLALRNSSQNQYLVSSRAFLTLTCTTDCAGVTRSGRDVFESTFSSETCTLDDSHTNPVSPLHNTPLIISATATPNEDDTYEERTSPSYIDPAGKQYSSPAEIFLNRKLELLRAKLTETSSMKDASDSMVQALTHNGSSLQHSKIAEKMYTEACLERLNVSECSSVNKSMSTQHTEIGSTKPFTAQCERLKMESLHHRMETQIKVGDRVCK